MLDGVAGSGSCSVLVIGHGGGGGGRRFWRSDY